jgi:site-specific DNA recombinase
MRAAGYVRVSQERAARNGYGLDAQEADIQRFVEYKNWELIELYREEGASGYSKDRPELDRLLADAKDGKFDAVVFPSIDRVGRSVRDVIDIDNALRNTGVDIVFVREGVDTSTPTGEFFEIIMASIAQFEGRIVYDRLSKGKHQKAAAAGRQGANSQWRHMESLHGSRHVKESILRWSGRIRGQARPRTAQGNCLDGTL